MDRTAQTITLRDGRKLGFAQWGDLDGKPVFFFGGSNSSRLMRHPDDSILHDLGMQLVTFDRPGLGLSTRLPERRLLDWAEDIRDFAVQKGIKRFAIVAASQGGPYGVACAYALPDLLSSVSLISGVAGLEDPTVLATQSSAIRSMMFIARRLPQVMTLQNNLSRLLINSKYAPSALRSILGNLPESDQTALDIPGLIEIMVQEQRESIRQGGAGATDDMRAVLSNWGFKLQDIQTKVFIWQGEDDPNVTPIMARYMAERIPHNEARFIPNAGHLLIYSHWKAILEQTTA